VTERMHDVEFRIDLIIDDGKEVYRSWVWQLTPDEADKMFNGQTFRLDWKTSPIEMYPNTGIYMQMTRIL
jgi:hypothetical protein